LALINKSPKRSRVLMTSLRESFDGAWSVGGRSINKMMLRLAGFWARNGSSN
jgi:hypothetical protein